MRRKICYHCGSSANSREHYPPKAFFPRKSNLKLKTVPSCADHNCKKSNHDQYVLAHIRMNASKGPSLARSVFVNSILPQLDMSTGFRRSILEGSKSLPDGSRAYPVNISRFDEFFDSLVRAILFDRYDAPFGYTTHTIRHSYLNFFSDDDAINNQKEAASHMLGDFFVRNKHLVEDFESDKIDEVIYANKIVDPGGKDASITITHSFYGAFEVVSYVSRIWPPEIANIFRSFIETAKR